MRRFLKGAVQTALEHLGLNTAKQHLRHHVHEAKSTRDGPRIPSKPAAIPPAADTGIDAAEHAGRVKLSRRQPQPRHWAS